MEAPPSCDSNPARPASTSLGDSPNFRRARTAAARLGIRRMNRQSSIFLNSCGVSIIWSRCPRVTEGCLLAGVNERPPLGFPCGLLVAVHDCHIEKNRSFGIARPSESSDQSRRSLKSSKPSRRRNKERAPTEADAPVITGLDRSHDPPELTRLGNRSLKGVGAKFADLRRRSFA